jgi:hypothetical protein
VQSLGPIARMKIPSWVSVKIQKGLEWRCQNREKSTILCHFLGIFEIFRGGKETPYHQSRKKKVNILPTHQSRKFCIEEVFSNFAPFGR